jgi:hypothetical protein
MQVYSTLRIKVKESGNITEEDYEQAIQQSLLNTNQNPNQQFDKNRDVT